MPTFKLLDKLENLSDTQNHSDEYKSVLHLLKISLNSARAQLNTVTDNMTEGFAHCKIICDSKGTPIDYKFLSINKAFTTQTGLEEKNTIGKSILEIYPDIEKSWIERFGKVAIKQEPITFTDYNHNTDKNFTTSAYSNAPGEFIMLFNDVSKNEALKKATIAKEEALKVNSEILSNMGEGFAHCEVVYNDKGVAYDFKTLQVNKAYSIHTGINNEDIVGKTMLEFFPDVEQSWLDIFIEVALTQKPQSFIDYNHNTGKYYDMNAYSPRKGFFIIIFKDVTETQEASKRLTESEHIKSRLLTNLETGYSHCEIICDENNKPIDYRILDVNPAYVKQTGISAKDIIGKTILEFYPNIEKYWIEIYGNVALNDQSHSFINFNHNTGKYYETNAYSLRDGQFALIFRDITKQESERIELENAYNKADENEKLKSAFLANMSHEIRTPMNAILGCSELLENPDLAQKERTNCLSYIKTSGNRLLNLISDIVDISKIDAQQQKLNYQNHNLNELLGRLRGQFALTNPNPRLALLLDRGLPDNESDIKTDEPRLIQILSNLLENAFKFTVNGKIEFGYTVKDEFLEFYVKDTGIGIKKEDQAMVFQRFRQATNTHTKMNEGNGLGISIVKGLVGLFEGDIWLSSEIGKGSEFYFKIPYIPIPKKAIKKERKLTILVAEDDEVNFYLLNIWMQDFCNVIHAPDGKNAIELYKKTPHIDLILMDIRMPYVNGIKATKEIRKLDSKIPIIANTAYAMNEESTLMMSAGCTDMLIKPVKREDFVQMLEKYIKI